ncbi:MAG: alpha/beta hydrolase-fold protein [Bacteroidota bacterium]|nr:alpha/beta hydrolase-fold protein [Bacteroidota bacterium]
MKHSAALLIMSLLFFARGASASVAGSGTLTRVSLASSETGISRNIDIWLPDDYDTAVKYTVIYMHDGQMLFDSTTTWNRQEWGVDETVAGLVAADSIKPCIIVGIWNRDKYRYTEYFPEKALDYISKRLKTRMIRKAMMGQALGDSYLRYLVKDVKPYIDANFSTLTGRENTVVMGSSMGGLISLYAICEYPDVFGGAGCISTHLPMKGVGFLTRNDNRVARAFRKYLSEKLPPSTGHRIYFDYGTETLDRWYEPYQKKVDRLLEAAGYKSGESWKTVKFEGEDHSERSWSRRLDIPLKFLIGSDR